MTPEGAAVPLGETEQREILQVVRQTIDEVEQATEALARHRLGDEAYERGYMLREMMETPPDIALPEDVRAQAEAQSEQRGAKRAYTILAMEPQNDDEAAIRLIMEAAARGYFPDDTVLSILDNPDKLAILGRDLIRAEDAVRAATHPDLEKLTAAYEDIFTLTQTMYAQATGLREESLELIVDSISITIDPQGQETRDEGLTVQEVLTAISQRSVFVSIDGGQLLLNQEPVTTQAQVATITGALYPFKGISQYLREQVPPQEQSYEPNFVMGAAAGQGQVSRRAYWRILQRRGRRIDTDRRDEPIDTQTDEQAIKAVDEDALLGERVQGEVFTDQDYMDRFGHPPPKR